VSGRWSIGAAAGVLVLLGALAPASPAGASSSETASATVGTAGACSGGKGVTVAVDLTHFGKGFRVRCAPTAPATGIDALRQAGFTVVGTKKAGLAFVCRINGLPTKAKDACIDTPPLTAYWAYYHAAPGATTWSYSTVGAASYHPVQGSIEGWAFGAGAKPSKTPAQVRATKAQAASFAGLAAAVPATAPPGSVGAAAAAYLASTLARGVYDFFGAPDYGLTADAVLALDALGSGQSVAGAATAQLAQHVGDYAGSGADVDAGALAKLLLVAVAQGEDPTSFGGHDLVADLAALQTPAGRFADRSSTGTDASNTFGQSLAVIALARQAGTAPAAATAYLLRQQCGTTGPAGFRVVLDDTPCAPGTAADVDATAMAIQALLAAGDTADAARALDWLAGRQAADGSFAGSPPTDVANANSTGLAVEALIAGGRTTSAAAGTAWLGALQMTCAAPTAIRGAVSYAPDSHSADEQGGVASDQLTRATTQAALGFSGVSLGSVTATGSADAAAAVDCSSPPPTSGPSTTSTSAPAGVPPTTAVAATSTTPSTGPAASDPSGIDTGVLSDGLTAGLDPEDPATLPATGSRHAESTAWLALLLLPAGAALVLLGRRRGAPR
jgi:hypothetical protein